MTSGTTIVALSSGSLPSGIAVIRISGPKTRFVLETIAGRVPDPRIMSLTSFRSADGTLLDRGLAVFFPGPHSFTGEDAAELHIHGGKAVVAAVLSELSRLEGVQQAEPGEFTYRAFLNGKLDLPAAEGLADLIGAETEAQRRFAVNNSQGVQSALYSDWRGRLIHARAMIEAEMDFSDEADIPGSVSDSIWANIDAMQSEIQAHVAGFHRAEMIRDGYDVVILGAPNAGKSSLLNALAQRDTAIVTDEPGTTRDLIEVSLDIGGVKVRLTDTAGIREGGGKVEAIGIERALERARSADLVLHLVDGSNSVGTGHYSLNVETLRVATKQDLWPSTGVEFEFDVALSTVTGDGMSELIERLGGRASAALGNAGDLLPSRQRHVSILVDCLTCLRSASSAVHLPVELRCEELRAASDRLGMIVGATHVEDLLGVIFSRFCIGK